MFLAWFHSISQMEFLWLRLWPTCAVFPLQGFQQEITLNTNKIDALIVFGENLIQKSAPLDAVLIEDELEELHSYCQEVFGRVARFHHRLVNRRPVSAAQTNLHLHFFFSFWCLMSFSSSSTYLRSWRRRGNCQTATQTWKTRPIWPTGPPGGTRGGRRRRRRWRRRFQQWVESQQGGRSCVTSWRPLWSGRDGRPPSAWTPSRWSGTTRSTWEDLHRTRMTRTPPSSAPCQVIMFPFSSVNYSLWLETRCVSVAYIISRCLWTRSQFQCWTSSRSLPRLPQNIFEKELLRVI